MHAITPISTRLSVPTIASTLDRVTAKKLPSWVILEFLWRSKEIWGQSSEHVMFMFCKPYGTTKIQAILQFVGSLEKHLFAAFTTSIIL